MNSSSQRSSGTELHLTSPYPASSSYPAPSPHPSQSPRLTSSPHPSTSPHSVPYRQPTSKIVRARRKCYLTLLSTCILLNGILSPAMTGLISHILAVTHDQVPKYGGDFSNGSSYFVAVTGALGVLDACFLFLLALCQDDVPLRWNWSGKTKHQQWKLPVHRIATVIALAAVLRGAAAAAYANYEYWDSDQSIDQNRGSDGTYYTPETWICYGATNQTVIEGEHPEYKWMCREAQGARYLTILTTIIAGITLILVLWRWRRSNLNKQYQPVASGRRDSDPLGQDVERGQGNGPEMRHTRLPSSVSIAPQEVVGREVYEMSADPIPEMEHRPVIRDSDELSIQGEPTQYFGHGYNPGQQHHTRSYDSP